MRTCTPGRTREQPITARPASAAVVAAVTAAVAPLVVTPPVEAATISPADTGQFRTVDLRAVMAARAEHADRSRRGLYPPAPRHVRPAAVQAAAPPVPPVQVANYRPRHQVPVPPKRRNGGTHYTSARAPESANVMVRFAFSQVGRRYVHGGTGGAGWDCSGLTQAAARLIGVALPHNADAQRAYVHRISRGELQPGDLIFYPGHVAVYAGNGMQIAAANTREGVVYQRVYGAPSMYGRL